MPRRKLTLQQAADIRLLREKGISIAQICRDFDTNPNTVAGICNGSLYRAAEQYAPAKAGTNSWKEGQRVVGRADALEGKVALTDLPEKADANSSEEDLAKLLAYGRKLIGKD